MSNYEVHNGLGHTAGFDYLDEAVDAARAARTNLRTWSTVLERSSTGRLYPMSF